MSDYLSKRALFPRYIEDEPNDDLFNIIVIPCYNEPDILTTLKSLVKCQQPSSSVEVIVVINASEEATEDVLIRNKETVLSIDKFISNLNTEFFKLHYLVHNDMQIKHAGVGLARKIGMDEACYRFEMLSEINGESVDGIITCLDADCTVSGNYFKVIENHFKNASKCPGVSIKYEHELDGHENEEEIIDYELHLRYYNQSLLYAGFPFAFQTVGSSMAVRYMAYMKQGGMNKRKAGEDFYFLHKFIQLDDFSHIDQAVVYPSARISDRVPFGTGRAMGQLKTQNHHYQTYPLQAFEDLKYMIRLLDDLYKESDELESWFSKIPVSLKVYIQSQKNYKHDICNVISNSSGIQSFKKRFFQWMSAFWVMKFLNNYRIKNGGEGVVSQAKSLLIKLNVDVSDIITSKGLLKLFRTLNRE